MTWASISTPRLGHKLQCENEIDAVLEEVRGIVHTKRSYETVEHHSLNRIQEALSTEHDQGAVFSDTPQAVSDTIRGLQRKIWQLAQDVCRLPNVDFLVPSKVLG